MKNSVKKYQDGGRTKKVTKSTYADSRKKDLSGEPKSGVLTHIVKTRPTITGGTKTVVKNKYNDQGIGGRYSTKSVTRTNSKGEITSMRKTGGAVKTKKK